MTLAAGYVLTEHRRRALATVRTAVLLALVMALALFLAAFWPAKEFAETAAYEHARFDVGVNGPLHRADVDRITRLLPANATCFTAYSGTLTSIAANGRALEGAPALLYPPGRNRDVLITYFSPGLLLKGDMDAAGSVGIDAITAARLGVGVGDFVTYRQRIDANSAHDLLGSGRITAVFAPTNATSGVVLPLSDDLGRALAGSEGIVGSDLFIRAGRASAGDVAAKLAALEGAEDWNVNTVDVELADARDRVEGVASHAIRAGMVLGALLVYAVYVLRDQVSRVERRRRDVAIMISLGEPAGRISAVFVAEQLTLAVATTVPAVWLARYVLENYLYLYVPGGSQLRLAAIAVALNVAIAVAVGLYLRCRVARMPVPRILAAE